MTAKTEKNKPRLHEVLAVRDSLVETHKKLSEEGLKTFKSKDHLFKGHRSTTTPTEENADGSTHVREESEGSEVAETVQGKLEYIGKSMSKLLDALAQTEYTNSQASADLDVDGNTMIEGAPATFLLSLEGRLRNFRIVVAAAPTCDMAKKWEPVNGQKNQMQAEGESRAVTRKFPRHEIVVPATPEHPAQFASYTEDRIVANKETTLLTGMITPARKSDILDRIDNLMRATKRARQRANQQELVKKNVGKAILDYILQS